jgi:uncharacterized protein (TIGR00369 family)
VTFEPHDPRYAERVRASFARQRFMQTLGATLDLVEPGEVHIGLVHRAELTQQHGYLHAGVLASVVDSACGYAALSLMEPGTEVLSIEFKINMLAPAKSERFVAIGRVLRSGRTITVCAGDAVALGDDGPVTVATMQATMIAVRREGVGG